MENHTGAYASEAFKWVHTAVSGGATSAYPPSVLVAISFQKIAISLAPITSDHFRGELPFEAGDDEDSDDYSDASDEERGGDGLPGHPPPYPSGVRLVEPKVEEIASDDSDNESFESGYYGTRYFSHAKRAPDSVWGSESDEDDEDCADDGYGFDDEPVAALAELPDEDLDGEQCF